MSRTVYKYPDFRINSINTGLRRVRAVTLPRSHQLGQRNVDAPIAQQLKSSAAGVREKEGEQTALGQRISNRFVFHTTQPIHQVFYSHLQKSSSVGNYSVADSVPSVFLDTSDRRIGLFPIS